MTNPENKHEKYRGMLWADCANDLERAEFIECGRAYATGVIAPSIADEVAEAFRFRYAVENGQHRARNDADQDREQTPLPV